MRTIIGAREEAIETATYIYIYIAVCVVKQNLLLYLAESERVMCEELRWLHSPRPGWKEFWTRSAVRLDSEIKRRVGWRGQSEPIFDPPLNCI